MNWKDSSSSESIHRSTPVITGTGGAPNIIEYLKERVAMHQKIETLTRIDAQIASLFEAIDSQRADAFLARLTEDCRFRFGSAPALTGHDAIRQSVEGLFGAIHSIKHTLETVWRNEKIIIVRGRVRYVFKEGRDVEIPFCDVLELGSAGRIRNYEIYSELGS